MNKHVLSVHEEENPFRCEICDYSFPLKSKMNKHVVSVHEEDNPFGCEICDYIFS